MTYSLHRLPAIDRLKISHTENPTINPGKYVKCTSMDNGTRTKTRMGTDKETQTDFRYAWLNFINCTSFNLFRANCSISLFSDVFLNLAMLHIDRNTHNGVNKSPTHAKPQPKKANIRPPPKSPAK